MLLTRLANGTHYPLMVSEGNGGVYSWVSEVRPGDHFDFFFDPNATYREFLIASSTIGRLIISTDDTVEYVQITIICEGEELSMKGSRRPQPRGRRESPLSRFLEWLGWRN